MKSIAAFFILIQILSNAFAVDIFSSDIRKFIDNAEACMHFSGEDGYNKERQEEIDRAVEKYCSLAKKERIFLKKKYKDQEEIQKKLDEYQDVDDFIF
ncbi:MULTISPECIES: hypothetical protein [unclassified Herbaspirillum]|uniref:hypothetical protein n=1 Tax=unclassified Herbaspirillum TaxID=2624150 RepID=UPI00383A55D2